MSTEDTKAIEEKVQAANAVEEAKWQDDFPQEQLTIKSKPDDTSNSDPKDDTGSKSDNNDEEGNKSDVQVDEQDISYSEPELIVTIDDPGEYVPQDYSFEIEVGGKTHKIDSAEKAAKIADKYAEDLDAKQLISLVTEASRIAVKQERDRDAWQSKKDQFESQSAEQQSRQETVSNLASEMDYLVSKGLMPKVDEQYKDSDWTDPNVASQPAVKAQIDLINYMTKENEVRVKAGVRPITSLVDAFNAYQLENNKQTAAEEQRQAAEERKAAGSRVAGVSPSNQQPYVPKGIAVGDPNKFRRGSVWED